jgi:hypothetical protein
MKIIPILFSTPMIQAILAERKSQTRRVIKPQPAMPDLAFAENRVDVDQQKLAAYKHKIENNIRARIEASGICRWQPGDILWVRETWCKLWHLDSNDQIIEGTEAIYYAADGYNPTPFNHFPDADGFTGDRTCPRWKPSIFMPREACSIWLRVKSVRAERVQDISEADVWAEGTYSISEMRGLPALDAYRKLWDSINAARGFSWESNPWVWVIEFEMCEKP